MTEARSGRQVAAVLIVSASCFLPRMARAADIAGGTAAAPVDITAHLIAGDALNFTGGYFTVVIPVAGTAGTTTPHDLSAAGDTQYPLYTYGAGHFADEYAPAIVYRKTITGTGTLVVSNATNATTNPSTDPSTGTHPFTGGVLLFTNAETFASGSAAATLLIQPNTTVAFDQGQSSDPGGELVSDQTTARNITNDGYLYQFVKSSSYGNVAFGDIVNTVPGAGVVTWENGGIASNGHTYRGHALGSAGAHIEPDADFGFDNVANLNDFTFETYGPWYLVGPASANSADPAHQPSIYAGNVYNPGIDIQGQSNGGSGVKIFTGIFLTPNGNTKKDFQPLGDSLAYSYFDHSKGDFSLSVYVQDTVQLGNGQAIIDYGNGLNNTAIQGNYTSTFLQTGNFETAPTSESDTYALQTLALDYSGAYHDDACLNSWEDSGHTSVYAPVAPGNFVVMNPDPGNTGKAPNHVIVTCPMLAQGLVRVEPNAILQLGDGTQGNASMKTVTLSTGVVLTQAYSDSSGNGMVITQLNSQWPALNPQWSAVLDDGLILVDNVPGALDMTLTWTDPGVVPLLQMNQLDTISGAGGVEQEGTLPLTLTGVSSYTGGTLVDAGATVIVGSATALGSATTTPGDGTGKVVNHGVLTHAASTWTLSVPGDYDQTATP
jgi:autotransporter-associated beta strand protein